MKLETLPLTDLGRAKKVIIDKDNTTIIEGAGKSADIQGRIAQIEHEYEKSTSDYDREKLQERKAKLSGGVAKISVGGATETEVKEKKTRFEDALNATRAAVEEGILAGGGVALIRAAAACKPVGLNHDEQTGYNIVLRACRSPLTWIAENAGKDGSLFYNQFSIRPLFDPQGDLIYYLGIQYDVTDKVKAREELNHLNRLLEAIGELGVRRTSVTLHVGRGTFLPVSVDRVEAHRMHEEWCEVSPRAAEEIRRLTRGLLKGESLGLGY